ncbi:MAG: amidohydrolase [Chitinophagaceae bacterium]|nr:amidohydrolase [Chitinophagaceae bacterium]
MLKRVPIFVFLLIIVGTTFAQDADIVIKNANIYTVNKNQPQAQTIALRDDKIIYVGNEQGVKYHIGSKTEIIDAKGKTVLPGFIEGHGHIHGMGASLIDLNLMNVKNWEEIVFLVKEAVKKAKPGDWIIGRGWHQEKWNHVPEANYLGYPYHQTLDNVSANNPVMLTHASGHSVYVNAKALELSSINNQTINPLGGDIVKDSKGDIVGVLEEKAQGLAIAAFTNWLNKRPIAERKAAWRYSINLAENECLKNGITSFVDAGSTFEQVGWMKELAEENKLSIRHWLMVRDGIEGLKKNQSVFPIQQIGNGHLSVKAIKVSLDGALGSYGAWLLDSYSDRKDFVGQNTFSMEELKDIASFAWDKNLQLCVHAIGDKANRETVNIFANQIAKNPSKDHRWRIEHAQQVNPIEIPRFKQWNIIASMQGIHCTSDAPYVIKRLGEERASTGSYMWRAFMNAGVLINNGTDVPVENIDPFANFYSSVTRKQKDGIPFYPEQKMTREEALYSYTLANAFATFEEKQKGSLEVGKFADLILLSNNIMACEESEISKTKVLMTIVGGKVKYSSGK